MSKPEKNAICGLWPHGSVAQANTDCDAQANTDCDELHTMSLQSWIRSSGGDAALVETTVFALCLNTLLLAKRHSPPVSALSLHVAPSALAAGSFGRGGNNLLALAAPGQGVVVFEWGAETSPEMVRLRKKQQEERAEEEEQRKLLDLRKQLQRFQQRIKEIERLEERAQEKGLETLSEEEKTKMQRREHFVEECQRISRLLGLDSPHDSAHESEEEDEHLAKVQAGVERRREKAKQQKVHNESKKSLQKERRQNRDQKGQLDN